MPDRQPDRPWGSGPLYVLDGIAPRIDPTAFIAPTAAVIGDVEIGPETGIWFGCVVRGDTNFIRIGARTNIQDGTIIHVDHATFPTVIGDDVTVGHAAIVHACTLKDRRVDHFVDTIFFRKRHEDEKALHTFAHEAAYITDAPTLLQRTKYVLDHHADAAFVSIALDDGDGLFANVSENDPAVVAMRARHKPIDLHTVQTALSGDFAYPMVTRGRLIGALVLGPKRSGESYAPDESDAIEYLAHSVGMALDVLATKTDGSRDALLQAIAGLSELTRAIYEQNRELKAIIAASLQTPDLEAESK